MKYHKLMPVGEFQVTGILGNGRFIGITTDVVNVRGYWTNQAVFRLIVIGIKEYYLIEEWITE
jgi:hypothetical protein